MKGKATERVGVIVVTVDDLEEQEFIVPRWIEAMTRAFSSFGRKVRRATSRRQ